MWLSPAKILGICRYAVLDTAECGIYSPMTLFDKCQEHWQLRLRV